MSPKIYDKDYLEFYDPNKCIGDLGEKWCKFKWRVYNVELSPNEIVPSPAFTTRLLPNMHWYLKLELLYPGELNTMKISLFRLQNHESVDVVVDVIYKVICNEEIQLSEKVTISCDNQPPWGDGIGFQASYYKSKKNYLTIECRLRPNKVMVRDVSHRNLDKYLPINLRRLLQSEALCDSVIVVGNHQLMAHRSILNARLPQIIEKCLDRSTGEKYIFKINDLPVSVVKEMLKYAYTGQACVDLEAVSISRDVLAEYSQNFVHNCCWDDHPSAETSFNYETDSLSWDLKDVFVKTNLDRKRICLFRVYPNQIELSLVVDESEDDKKWLILTFKYLSEKMPKRIMISCSHFLVNKNNEIHELGVSGTLLSSSVTTGKIKICSLHQVKEGSSFLRATNDCLVLKTDFKFCYGGSKSSIENIYGGQFNISQCTSCIRLSAEMEALYRSSHYWNISVESEDGQKFFVHKEILLARWVEAEKLKVKDNRHIVIEGSKAQGLSSILLQLYKGTSLK